MSVKPLHELSFEEYMTLIDSGMMYEFYPECTGSYKTDTTFVDANTVDTKGLIESVMTEGIGNIHDVNKPEDRIAFKDLKESSFYQQVAVRSAQLDWPEERMDIVGQNGNDGTHYKDDD
jgi:hypothetical protein